MLEDEVQSRIRLEAPKEGVVLFRNNSGVFKEPGSGRPVRFGLGNESKKMNEKFKSSDLIGITSVVVTPEMVGQTIGVFTAVEAKREGWTFSLNDVRAVAQRAFIDFVLSKGGYAGFANSVATFRNIIRK